MVSGIGTLASGMRFLFLLLGCHTFMQPVKMVDPHLVSSFFDDCKRAYLHTTVELVNQSKSVVDCSLNIQVGAEQEGDIFLVEHLQTQHVYIPAGSHVQHTLPEVGLYPWCNQVAK
ncbi:UNVERIFIED_CONTAM: Mannosylglycoprotein endo-beta-mannosidase [Sesamum angustifolium]|uniref:Mannosylglycoprotein endo-beta-mannosidase n=1 Tax=Sesamum angustifolium TaxID=2727405 RepID=A0AAW2NW33_9LAMI